MFIAYRFLMLDINKLKNKKTLFKLESYFGKNEYLLSLKEKLLKEGNFNVPPSLAEYIDINFERDPIEYNKVINITEFFGKQLQEKFDLNHTPTKILIETVLGETDKSYHIKGKVFKNQKYSPLFYVPKTQISENLFDVAIDVQVDFEKYHKMDKRGWKLFPHQEDGVKFLLTKNNRILGDDMGLGKVIANDTPVLTPNGWVEHGSLKVGDYVIGSDGKPTKVLAVYPNPLKDYYNITFTDGTVVEACDEHLWSVYTPSQKKRNTKNNILTIKDMLDKEKTVVSDGVSYNEKKKYITKTYYKLKNGDCKWYIPMVKPVEFNPIDVKIDPYLLGVLLGDLKEEISFGFIMKDKSRDNNLLSFLRYYKLLGTKSDNKFIPEDYKFNTVDIRLEVLQGLLDTEGYCSKNGTIQHYSVSKQLSDDVKELVQSLGGVARQRSKVGSYRLPSGELKECKICYTLTINLPEYIKPFKLTRKLENMVNVKKYHPSRGIKNIEFSRQALGQCITVEAEDSLYVIDQYVVTHNTIMSTVASIESGSEKILIVCPANAKINWFREINAYIPEEEISIIKSNKWNPKRYTIINYDILKNFHTIIDGRVSYKEGEINRDLDNHGFDLIILDECFTYDTKIKTDVGYLEIGKIVESNLDVKVLSYNITEGKLEYKKINRWIQKETDNTLLKIKLSKDIFIKCTPNHKIYVKDKGYVKAEEIKQGDELYYLSKNTNGETNKERGSILFNELFSKMEDITKRCNRKNKKISTKLLFTRHWESKTKDSHRNRWVFTQNQKMEIFGQEKNRGIEFFRVESVEVLERGGGQRTTDDNREYTKVYDLEIDGNHNYFANNILVSNCHMAKNPTSGRAKIITQISKKIQRKWLLTGTPLANRPMDFYNLLKICDSPVVSSWNQYAFRYCDGKKFRKKLKTGKYKDIWLTDGASNLEELHERTKDLILRRKKDDHLDLPPKIVAPYYMEIDDMVGYNKAFEEYLEWAKSEGKKLGAGRHMVELIVLRKFLALEKTKQSIALAEQSIENGKKVIIFTNFTHSFDALMKHFGKLAVGHNGKMNSKQKQESVDRFQNDPNVMVFVGNLISAGTAITLTEAEVVIMNDLDFVPANHAQAEDRSHRIGSQSTTNVYYPIVIGTIDEMMFKILEKKRKIIDTVIGDEHISLDIEEDLFGEFKNFY